MIPGQTTHKKYCRNEDDVFYHTVMMNTKTKAKAKAKTKTKTAFRPHPDCIQTASRPDQILADLILELAFKL